MEEAKRKPNEIIKFLEGTWTTRDTTIMPNQEVKIQEYKETMKIKDSETITVTAMGINKGKDVTRDIIMKINGDEVIMSQGDFSATGIKKGNYISLRGTYQDRVYDFRLYILKDK